MMKTIRMKKGIWLMAFIAGCISCGNQTDQADAYGTFEATEVILSSQTTGPVLRFEASEGMKIAMDEEIALIDTSLFHFQKAELEATMQSVRTKTGTIAAQNEILKEQIANLNVNIDRTGNMLKADAATRKQYDDLTGQLAVLQKQIAANNAQMSSVASELSVLNAKRNTLLEQEARCSVRSPIHGVLVEKYVQAGEMVTAGKPVAKIADLSVMNLKVYVSGAQLGKLRTGQNCKVQIDDGKKGYRSFTGRVAVVAARAEFTPKIIQTKEERVTLVYAVTIEVKNDGTLKSGMPGEAIF